MIGGGIGLLPGALVGGLIGGLIGAYSGFKAGVKEAAAETLATPRGVGLLRRLAEGFERETRSEQEEGGHSQIAKDQPGHEKGDPLNDMREFRFRVSQECAVRADKEIVGAMRAVLDAAPEAVDGEMAKVLTRVDSLIGPVAGHPYEGMVKTHKKEADELVERLVSKSTGHRARARRRAALTAPRATERTARRAHAPVSARAQGAVSADERRARSRIGSKSGSLPAMSRQPSHIAIAWPRCSIASRGRPARLSQQAVL